MAQTAADCYAAELVNTLYCDRAMCWQRSRSLLTKPKSVVVHIEFIARRSGSKPDVYFHVQILYKVKPTVLWFPCPRFDCH